jgi:pilus assembly protein CpaB
MVVPQPVLVRQETPRAQPTRTVVVAAVPLKFGTPLSAEVLSEIAWPADAVPPDTFASKSAVISAGRRVVLAAIAKNEPIMASKISAPGQGASLSLIIEEGKTAVTIRVDDVLGVAGFVQPDDRVDVLLTRSERAGSGAPGAASTYTDVLLQNVRVLAIDQLADRNIQAKPVKAVTVEVGPEEAQKLVLAASVGQLSLALRRAGSLKTSEARRIGLEDLPNSRPAVVEAQQLAPLTPEQVERGPVVTVIRGVTERKQYDVGSEPGRSVLETLAAEGLRLGAAAVRADQERSSEATERHQPR